MNGDTNNAEDIFLRDTQSGTTVRVSVDSNGVQGNGPSISPVISANGRYIAFDSLASNLVNGDTNLDYDVFLRDMQAGTTTLVTANSDGVQGNGNPGPPSISADGRYVAFVSNSSNLVNGDTNNKNDVFLRDTQNGTTTRVSESTSGEQGNNSSLSARISADGRHVAFVSTASNLVSGDTNNTGDVFMHDTQTSTTTLVSVNSSGMQVNYGNPSWPTISADGRYVVFSSYASGLVNWDSNNSYDIFIHDTQTGTTAVSRWVRMGRKGMEILETPHFPRMDATWCSGPLRATW